MQIVMMHAARQLPSWLIFDVGQRKMKSPDYVLTFVRGEEGELFMHADAKGLSVLIGALERLKKKADEGVCDHDHLMTPAWAGSELSETKGLESGELIHHLKLYGWTEEWARKHGFRA